MIVFDLDDLCDDFDPWDELHALKERIPNLKVTLFAIPGRCSPELLERYRSLLWVEVGVHGYHHSAQECIVWGYDETASKLEELEGLGWNRVFKAPTWQMNEQVYAALFDRGWTVADHAAYAWPSMRLPIRRYTYNLPGQDIVAIHGHTWETNDNGPSVWSQMDVEGEFAFVSEAARELSWGYEEMDVVQNTDNSWSHVSAWGKMALENFVMCFRGVEEPGKIADFGGNDGFVAFHSGKDGYDVTVVDGVPNRVAYADRKHGVKAVCANLANLPIADDTFDWGYCSHTLEHIPDIMAAWNEIKRLCKKGCFVVVPVEDEEKFNDSPAHHHRNDHDGWCEMLGLEKIYSYDDALVGVWRR